MHRFNLHCCAPNGTFPSVCFIEAHFTCGDPILTRAVCFDTRKADAALFLFLFFYQSCCIFFFLGQLRTDGMNNTLSHRHFQCTAVVATYESARRCKHRRQFFCKTGFLLCAFLIVKCFTQTDAFWDTHFLFSTPVSSPCTSLCLPRNGAAALETCLGPETTQTFSFILKSVHFFSRHIDEHKAQNGSPGPSAFQVIAAMHVCFSASFRNPCGGVHQRFGGLSVEANKTARAAECGEKREGSHVFRPPATLLRGCACDAVCFPLCLSSAVLLRGDCSISA